MARQRSGKNGTFVQQAEHADPRGHVEHREDLGRIARAPRCAGIALLHERAPKGDELAPDVPIDAVETGQRRDA